MRRRIPVVHQLNSFECGAACLAMILEHFGRKTRLEECRALCDPGRNGTTARTILAAAAQFGLSGRAFAVLPAQLDAVPLPCIVFWNRSHFVVLERWSRHDVDIVDPAAGRRRMPFEEFEAGFSGIALRLEPGPGFRAHGAHGPSPSWTFLRRIARTPGLGPLIGRIVGLSLLLQAFGFLVPLLTKVLIDTALPAARMDLVELFALGSVMLALFSGGMAHLRAYLLLKLETKIDSLLMDDFVRHLLSLPFRFFQLRNSGDLLMRLSSNAAIREALASCSASAILDGLLVVVFLAALVAVCYPAALLALIVAAAEVGVLAATSSHASRLVAHHIASQAAAQSSIVESLMGISTVKAAGAEASVLARWSDLLGKQLKSAYARGEFGARTEAALMAIRTLSPLLLLCLGAKLVIEGSLTAGTMLAVNAMAAAFLQPVGSLVMNGQRLYFARAHLLRIADVMQSAPEQDPKSVRPAGSLTGHIEIRNLRFRYDAHSPDVLKNINLTVRPGQKIALVGRTGSGKSTLAKLLLGLYVPTDGEILYDGAPLKGLNLQTVRRQWGVALQEPFLFSSSLRENLALCNAALTDAEMIRAARLAEIHDDIAEMPMGYETRIDEAGQSLSGGQRQRIAIARAVAGAPALLLLDEATSHLDTITERAVDRNLDTLRCTRLVIAHRLSTIQNADLIVVLEDGSIAEQGTHEELLARDGVYAALTRPRRPEAVPA